jgi:hypothetical protein
MMPSLDRDQISQILERRLVRVSPSVRKFLPPVLSSPKVSWAIFPTDAYLLVVFLSDQDKRRIQTLIAQKYHPFPGLITQAPNVGAAFRVESSRNIVIQSCTAKNIYTLWLGKDSTVILEDHTQSVDTQELGQYEYKISLAYVISYGDEINEVTVYDYLEDLIAYTISGWRSRHAE